MPEPHTYKRFGERAILIEWPAVIDEKILSEIINFKQILIENTIESIQDVIIGYNSLTVVYNQRLEDVDKVIEHLKSLESIISTELKIDSRLWTIPVCYDETFGIDLATLSQQLGLSIKEIIELHTKAVYTIFFLGFLPGFMYLGGLDKKLFIPRKENPRLKVEKGSVGIGGSQTGIYPSESAGGWNIMGRTPINLFDVTQDPPCFAKSGDKIRFKPISIDEFQAIDNDSTLRSKFFTNA